MHLDVWQVDREIDRITEFYNRQMLGVPYVLPVTSDEYLDGIEREDWVGGLSDQQVFVCLDGDEILAYAHCGIWQENTDDPERVGAIRMLLYEEGDKETGRRVLDAVQDYFVQIGLTEIRAFSLQTGFPFYHAGRGFLSDRLARVHGLLLWKGYRADQGQLFLEKVDLMRAPDSVAPRMFRSRSRRRPRRAIGRTCALELWLAVRSEGDAWRLVWET